MHHVVVHLGYHRNPNHHASETNGFREQVYHGQRAACLDWLGLQSLQILLLLLPQQLRQIRDLIVAK